MSDDSLFGMKKSGLYLVPTGGAEISVENIRKAYDKAMNPRQYDPADNDEWIQDLCARADARTLGVEDADRKYIDRHIAILNAEREVLAELAIVNKLAPEGWPIDEQAWEYYSRELSRRLRV